MSEAIKKMRDFLTLSPSVVFPDEVLELFEPIEEENAKLRELVRKMMRFFEDGDYCAACEKVAECDAQEEYDDDCLMRGVFHANMRELDVEVDK